MVRLRHRYIVASVECDGEWKGRDKGIFEAINKAIKYLHGVQGVALCKAGLHAKYVNNSTKICFIRMRRSAYELVSSSLPYVSSIDGQPMRFKTLYTGASIRHCNIFLRSFHRRELETIYGSLCSEMQKNLFETQLQNVKYYSIS